MKARIPNQNNGSRNDMMKKLQQMQEDMANAQEQVENSEFSSSAGGGAVEVTVSGKHEILNINIKPEVVDPDDIEMLQDLLIASLNEAIRKANDAMESAVNGITGGMNIPGLGF